MSPARRWAALGLEILLSTGLLPAMALAHQTGGTTPFGIAGRVRDARTGEAIGGANAVLAGTAFATQTDAQGRFALTGIDPGAHELEVSCVGYQTARTRVVVDQGRLVRVRVDLSPEAIQLSTILVQADRDAVSAPSSAPLRQFDLETRPRGSAAELMELAPGLVAVRHSGGKAQQIFLRGFNAGFGTDVSVAVDGVPVNLVSHGHGQGYADLSFLIPEVVERVEVYKGPYLAEYGNLASAGQILFHTREHIDRNALQFERGGFNTARCTLLYHVPPDSLENNAYFAGDYYRTDGPFLAPQNMQRLTLFAKVHRHLSSTASLALELGGFGSAWDASSAIPERALAAGRVSRFGSLHDGEGGTTSRYNLSMTLRARGPDWKSEFVLQPYFSACGLKLSTDYTEYLQDIVYGDMVEQTDDRWVAGVKSRYSFGHAAGPFLAAATLGGGLRADHIDLAMWQAVRQRRYWPLVDARVQERNYSLWAEEEITLRRDLALVAGLRQDYFTFDVEDRLEIPVKEGVPTVADLIKQIRARRGPLNAKLAHFALVQPHVSGVVQQGILSPKASLVYSPAEALDLFANLGMGFHSNDARSVAMGRFVRDQTRYLRAQGVEEYLVEGLLDTLHLDPRMGDAPVLPRTTGAEVGVRLRVSGRPGVRPRIGMGPGTVSHFPGGFIVPAAPAIRLDARCNLGAALWWIDVEDEYIYAAELATAERQGPTRRWGVDVESRMQLWSWLWADADLNWAHARLRHAPAGKDRVPLAPRLTAAGGLTAHRSGGWEGRLRFRHLADRPATEDGRLTAQGYVVWDASAACRRDRYALELFVDNLFDTEWREAQYAIQSVLSNELPQYLRGPAGPADVNFVPGDPRRLRARLTRFF